MFEQIESKVSGTIAISSQCLTRAINALNHCDELSVITNCFSLPLFLYFSSFSSLLLLLLLLFHSNRTIRDLEPNNIIFVIVDVVVVISIVKSNKQKKIHSYCLIDCMTINTIYSDIISSQFSLVITEKNVFRLFQTPK